MLLHLQQVIKHVDDVITLISIVSELTYLKKAGGTMTGDFNMGNHKITNVRFDNNPTSVARIQELSLKFDKIGGVLNGPIDMNENSILNKNPQLDYEAVHKNMSMIKLLK